jgi:hypothetical protein
MAMFLIVAEYAHVVYIIEEGQRDTRMNIP